MSETPIFDELIEENRKNDISIMEIMWRPKWNYEEAKARLFSKPKRQLTKKKTGSR